MELANISDDDLMLELLKVTDQYRHFVEGFAETYKEQESFKDILERAKNVLNELQRRGELNVK